VATPRIKHDDESPKIEGAAKGTVANDTSFAGLAADLLTLLRTLSVTDGAEFDVVTPLDHLMTNGARRGLEVPGNGNADNHPHLDYGSAAARGTSWGKGLRPFLIVWRYDDKTDCTPGLAQRGPGRPTPSSSARRLAPIEPRRVAELPATTTASGSAT
jgi:hypothetical protein